MTEAVRAVLAFGFGQLGLHRLFATVHPDNLASLRLLERVGMRREGVLRQEAFIKGEWWDVVYWALLASEWQPGSLQNRTGEERGATSPFSGK